MITPVPPLKNGSHTSTKINAQTPLKVVLVTIQKLREATKSYIEHANSPKEILKLFPLTKLSDENARLLFDKAFENDWHEIVEYLLDHYFSSLSLKSEYLTIATIWKKPSIVKKLLKSSSIDPSIDKSECLRQAHLMKHEEITLLFLKDKRADPSQVQGFLEDAQSIEIAKLLLEDERIDPNQGRVNHPLITYHHQKRSEMIKPLLQDKRVNPEGHKSYDSWLESYRTSPS